LLLFQALRKGQASEVDKKALAQRVKELERQLHRVSPYTEGKAQAK
jgi:hypothetical protein